MIVGDPRLTIATCEGTTPNLAEIQSHGEDQYEVSIHAFPAPATKLGALSMPYLDAEQTYTLNSGQLVTKTVTLTALQAYLDLGQTPVRLNDSLTWSDQLTPTALFSHTASRE